MQQYNLFVNKGDMEAIFEEARALSARTGAEIQANLSPTARPEVDTSSIAGALSMARRLGALLQGLGGGKITMPTVGAPPAIDGARARGGPVQAGKTYLVGEERPELFTPDRSGRIIPEVPAGGGRKGVVVHAPISIVQHITGSSADMVRQAEDAARRAAMAISKELDRQLNRSAQIGFGGLKPYSDA